MNEKGERSFYAVAPGRDTSVENSRFTPSQFAWSPDGARLAIAGTQRMFVLDIETGEANEATIGDHAFRYLPTWHWPEWSPSSDKVAFTAFVDDPATCMGDVCGDGAYWNHAAEMFLYDATKGTTSRLTHNDINDTVRSWSPDGTRIAFTQSRVDMGIFARYWYPESLHIIEIMTGTVTDVYAYAQSDGEVWWSPDGSHLAFIGTVEELELYQDHRVFLAASDSSAVKQLTPDVGPEKLGLGWVIGWSPDGRFIAHSNLYFGSGASTETQYIHDVAGGANASIDLSINATLRVHGWNSDGTRLLFMEYPPRPNDQHPLALIGVDPLNGDAERLVEISAQVKDSLATAIAPDASQLAFIFDDLQFALIGNTWTDLRSHTEIPLHLPADGFPLCDLSWTVTGIRGNCAVYYDF